jgi:hypothetical protein
MKKPTDAEVLQLALEPDIDLEYERVLRMSDAEVRQSLIARGHDLRVLEAEADILWNMYRPKKTHQGRYIAGAFALVGSAGAAAAALLGPFAQAAAPALMTASPPPGLPDSQTLREEGLAACQEKQWQTCIDKLDEAARIDPASATRPAVIAAHEEATRNLAHPKQ